MQLTSHDPPLVPAPGCGYANALEVVHATRTLFISGQIPESRDGTVPDAAEDQCRHPALTVVEAGIFDQRWLLEIEAVAAG